MANLLIYLIIGLGAMFTYYWLNDIEIKEKELEDYVLNHERALLKREKQEISRQLELKQEKNQAALKNIRPVKLVYKKPSAKINLDYSFFEITRTKKEQAEIAQFKPKRIA